ncbi:MAG: hypothetical protein JSW62_03450 [Thermoplasmatales archaeon]|nr:MAG: hypothetical protein JSW62_03450 [Thermoplasmatales archaeon]
MPFHVESIIDGDTFDVTGWRWGDEIGTTVRPIGYDAPEEGEPGYDEATKKLRDIILNRKVILKNVTGIDHGCLVCDVYYNGKNLADYFPEYKK